MRYLATILFFFLASLNGCVNQSVSMETRVFKVDGMMCNHCRANVEKTMPCAKAVP